MVVNFCHLYATCNTPRYELLKSCTLKKELQMSCMRIKIRALSNTQAWGKITVEVAIQQTWMCYAGVHHFCLSRCRYGRTMKPIEPRVEQHWNVLLYKQPLCKHTLFSSEEVCIRGCCTMALLYHLKKKMKQSAVKTVSMCRG